MNRHQQKSRPEHLWTLFIDGCLDEQQDVELADWLAKGGRVEGGTLDDLDCHQLLRAEGHVARTENDFICDLIICLSPQFIQHSKSADAQDEMEPDQQLAPAPNFTLRRAPSEESKAANQHTESAVLGVTATIGSFVAVAILLYCLLSGGNRHTSTPTAPASTSPELSLSDAALESDPLSNVDPVVTSVAEPTLVVAATEPREAVAISDEALDELLDQEDGNPSVTRGPEQTYADGEAGIAANTITAIESGTGAAIEEQDNSEPANDGPAAANQSVVTNAVDDHASHTEDAAEVEVKATAEPAVKTAPPIKLNLVASDEAIWDAAPTSIQHELLRLNKGEATIVGDFGKLIVKGPSTIFVDLPTRVTLQEGEISVAVNPATPLMIDTAFGSAVARGQASVVCNVDGMSVRTQDEATVSSPADSWQIAAGGHKLLTATGDAFDWYVSLDLTTDTQRLVVNGATVKLPTRNMEALCARRISSALQGAEKSAKQLQRLDFNGVLRVNSMVKTYKKTHDLLVARNDAQQFVAAARRARSGREPASDSQEPAQEPAGLVNANVGVAAWAAGAAINQGANAAAMVAAGAAMNAALDVNVRPANPPMADMMQRAMQPMTSAMQAMAPVSIPKDIPRLQWMNDAQLQQQLLTLPEVEIYRNDREALRMAEQLGKVSRIDARSVPPRREPVFEILPMRPDLQGLPFQRGEQCRLPRQQQAATASLSRVSGTMGGPFLAMSVGRGAGPAQLPGLIQILQAKSPPERIALNQILMNIGTFEALQALAKQAIFDVNPIARNVAITGLKNQQGKIRAQLLAGLRYPWAPVAAHAAEALVRLEDKEAVPSLIAMLDEPHPSAPEMVNGRWMTREVVRLNHMKNCMLCHAPSTSQNDLMRARVPVPGNSQITGPDPVAKYYGPKVAPGPFVRADITYLRQDFSITTYTDELAPWPKQQRSDFLVRTRPVTAQEMLILNQRPLGRDYPQRRAVLFALQQLTGLDLGNESAAWRDKLLAKN